MKRCLAENIQTVSPHKKISGVQVGKIVRVDMSGQVLVDFPGNTKGPVLARFVNSVTLPTLYQAASVGSDVLLVFENSDPALPIVIDTLHSLLDEITTATTMSIETEGPKDITVDGKRVRFDAEEEIVLRCGKASITLTRAGKILIRGAYLLNRSSGVNRIKGGSVQIN